MVDLFIFLWAVAVKKFSIWLVDKTDSCTPIVKHDNLGLFCVMRITNAYLFCDVFVSVQSGA